MWRLTKDPKYREWGWEAVQVYHILLILKLNISPKMWAEFWNTHLPLKYGLPADFQKENEPSQWVWTMFVQALENSCRTDGGYTGIRDVYQVVERISSALLFKRFLLQGWWKQGWCATFVLPGGDPQVPLPALQWRAYHQHGPVGLQHRGGIDQLDNGDWSTTDCRHILYLSEEWTLSIDHILSFRVILNFLSGWFPSSLAMIDTHVFKLNEHSVELNPANFKVLNQILNWIHHTKIILNNLLNWILS